MSEPVEIFVPSMNVGSGGVRPFYWPVSVASTRTAMENFASDFFTYINSKNPDLCRNAELLWLTVPEVVSQFASLFTALSLQRHLAADGREIADTWRGQMITPVLRSMTPSPLELGAVAVPQAKTGIGRRWFRRMRHRMGLVPYAPARRHGSRRGDEILTFSWSAHLGAHAAQSEKPVVLGQLPEWLGSDTSSPEQPDFDYLAEALGAVVEAASGVMFAAGIEPPKYLSDYFARILFPRLGELETYLRRAEAIPKHELPDEYWSASGGNILGRLFARVVQKRGGVTVSHDHGTGSGWRDGVDQTLFELNYHQFFYAFSAAMAEGLRDTVDAALIGQPERERQITHLNIPITGPPTARGAPRASTRVTTVLYVAVQYTGEYIHPMPLLADIVAVDWQARLFAHLEKRGLKVLFKPYPNAKILPPDQLLELSRIKILDNALAEAIKGADVLLFDCPQTTAFRDALWTNHPIVLIDIPRIRINDQAKHLLSKRVSIVSAELAENNRVCVDWHAVDEAISSSIDKVDDQSFVTAYYPYVLTH